MSNDNGFVGQWHPCRWWRVLADDGSLWMETSDEDEARASAKEHGYRLARLWREVPRDEWREVD